MTTEWNSINTMELNQIIGLEEAKESISRDLTLRSIKDQPQRMILLEGASGTCKSTLILALVKKFGLQHPDRFEFMELRTDDVTGHVTTTSEKIQEFWRILRRYNKPIILFVDEADDIFASRKNAGHIKNERTINIMLELNKEIPNLYIIAATNRPFLIDRAILERFSKRINCPYPTDSELRQIINVHLSMLNEQQKDVLYKYIICSSVKWSGRDLKHMAEELILKQEVEKLTNPGYVITSQDICQQFGYIDGSKHNLRNDYLDA